MKTIKLKTLELVNFKGTKHRLIEFKDDVTQIFGANGSGKTTVAEAIYWLLFDKNSLGKSPQVVPYDTQGIEINELDVEVKALFDVNGSDLELIKRWKSEFVNKRGSLTKVFKNRKGEYFINEVPKLKKEFEEYIATNLIDIDTFKLLTNPHAFNQMDWKTRRDMLLDMFGDVSDEVVFNSNKELLDLQIAKGDNDVDDYRKTLSVRFKELKERQKEIPIRIEELLRKEVPSYDQSTLSKQLEQLSTDKKTITDKINSINSNNYEQDLLLEKRQLEQNRKEIVDNFTSIFNKQKQDKLYKVTEQENDINKLKNSIISSTAMIENINFNIEEKNKIIARNQDLLQVARKNYLELQEQSFDKDNCTCPTCKQTYPIDMQEELEAKFNLDKANKLEKFKEDGRNSKSAIERLTKEVTHLQEDKTMITYSIDEFESAIQEREDILKIHRNELDKLIKDGVQYDNNTLKLLQEVDSKITDVLSKLENIDTSSDDASKQYKEQLTDIDKQINDIQLQQAEIIAYNKDLERIEQLKQEEQEVNSEYEQLDRLNYLIDEFIKTKVELLTNTINKHFKAVEFKMFEIAKNDSLKETCQVMVDGVEWGKGLNTAAQLNAGLDIINALCDYHKVYAPIFIDNAESVTDVLVTQSQQIQLIVNAKYRELNIK